MKRNCLAIAVGFALCAAAPLVLAQSANSTTAKAAQPTQARDNVSSTSNSTRQHDTKRAAAQLDAVSVQADTLSIGSGLMEVQTAPKAVSTISREAIQQAAPGATFVQMLSTIPGVNASTDDNTGLNDGNLTIRGYTMDEVGVTVNGAPINDAGNYKIYATEYGDTENMGDITVQQGFPDQDSPIPGAAGGSIAWVTIDPSHKAGVDISQSIGSYGYNRTFVRLNTGDTGPFRSWISYSNNEVNNWRGPGGSKVAKVDAKTIWTINDKNSISASLQYNREAKTNYMGLTKAQAGTRYQQSYSPTFVVGSASNNNFYRYHYNPYRSLLVSLDGEFTLSDNLHLSVVPYFQYGYGGGGSGTSMTESTSSVPMYGYVNADLNGDGVITNGKKVSVAAMSYNYTYRPGVVVKFNQNIGQDNTLEYGIWTEGARQQNGNNYMAVDPVSGAPADAWAQTNLLRYSNGRAIQSYDQYTNSTNRKAFVTDTWTPTDQLTFTLGAAYVWTNRSGYVYEYPTSQRGGTYNQFGGNADQSWHKVTPSGGAKFQLDDRNQFYLGIGKTFRAPIAGSLYNPLLGSEATTGLQSKPESSWTYDLGWRFYGSRVSAVVDAYASNFSNKQISGYDQNTFQTVYLSLGRVHMRGLNTELNVKLSQDWSIYGSYSYTQAIMQDNLNSGGDGIYYTRGKTLLNTPRNLLNVGVSFHHGPAWASLSTRTSSAFYGDWSNTEKVGGYTTLNLNAGWNFHDWGFMHKPYIKINGFNLLNRRAFTFASNISAFMASNPGKIKDVNGTTLYASSPYYSLLEGRSGMITIGASFF
ncbi:TonB-dependent receptor [Frateuria aurantia]|uniref:Outer membrane receptor protein n=1 Tax=Frateuria aurantia (strain ATCC 33424 / DSM 6220 / KCTC 2777 / LMG 1558 / NBRC 3245 / NCIMB 13370) TaxID=767434 RepID=H8L705_FRAAD|nr:TonB-dependent receptor [Frateuria aurantia]AFC86915.1 outer membrane receptor protein [Frateuria aurantia DSM 6220]